MTSRVVLLATSARVAPGLLSWPAWDVLRSAPRVLIEEEHPLLPYIAEAGVVPDVVSAGDLLITVKGELDEHSDGLMVAVIFRPDGDPDFARSLSTLMVDRAAASGAPAVEVEILPASYDLPGARVIDLVAVMDRLRSPGGCPWDAEQTHASLATYLLEEAYETLEAIDSGDRDHLREELGDLLLQVVFHARIATEDGPQPWSVDDVAGDIVDKLVRRHPHVFEGGSATTAADVEAGWELQKAVEKGRSSAVDGVPLALPALALATKLIHRARSKGVDAEPVDGDDLGARLMALVVEALVAGQDAETELRAAARRYAERIRTAEE